MDAPKPPQPEPVQPLDWADAAPYFADADKAREYLEALRWGKAGAVCPHCGGADPYKLTPKADSKRPGRKGLYKCRACRKQFTATVGTIFEDSHIPLNKWLQALYLITSSKKGISSHQLHRMLGVTYKSAWFMTHRLRFAMTQEPIAAKLAGIVEVDETYVGGRRRVGRTRKGSGRPGPDDKKKTAVMALVERKGRVRAFPVERVTSETAQKAIREAIERGSRVMTDEFNVYHGTSMGYKHETVHHASKEYVRGDVYTNSVEGFFSLLKRGINGTFHHIGKGHIARYIAEFEFRYNARQVSDAKRAALLVEAGEGKRLTYKQPAGTRQN
jgi:transposase-like protein